MPISSMTGFARADGHLDTLSWVWEVRSVNGRGLDVRSRLPQGYDNLEAKVRDACTKRFQRGNLQIGLQVRQAAGTMQIRLNEMALQQVLAAGSRAAEIAGTTPPSLDSLLALRGVLEMQEAVETEDEIVRRTEAMTHSLEQMLDELARNRAEEGRRLQQILVDQLDRIKELTGQIAQSPARSAEAIRQRLSDQLERILGEAAGRIDDNRLYQEAAMLASRADVEEELKRLGSHLTAVRELIAKGGAIGRQLDFLAQEFNREANTLCSKSNDTEITRAGLALKGVIDQMREQVQNIE